MELYGGDGNDVLHGSQFADLISGGEGADKIYAYGGADIILAGNGDDSVSSGTGNDFVCGDGGNDKFNGENGNDWIYGGGDAGDQLNGGNGSNRVYYEPCGASRSIVVDWNGDGVFHLDQETRGFGFQGNLESPGVSFGLPFDIPVSGDWDGDRLDDIGVVRGNLLIPDEGQWGFGPNSYGEDFGYSIR